MARSSGNSDLVTVAMRTYLSDVNATAIARYLPGAKIAVKYDMYLYTHVHTVDIWFPEMTQIRAFLEITS